MRLKKLILHGFKSFADRTEFSFDTPITGIVGPNGCGKSNVVDAFKWVLGEQSAKSLRGEAMLDVIFNGSGNRKPSGMAEVTLVFDNPPRADGTRVLALEADEVAVGRRLYRDATSEYTVNNQSSRLKDIRELFLDTGVGADAYSVIEQGRVAAMLDANPAERRVIFEEAAGISKYKVKKKEAQRKLEKVDQNLLRVNDIVEEVEKRLRSVKMQAGRARTFQEHSTRLRELRLQYALQEYHTQHQQQAELCKSQEESQFRLEDLATDLQRGQSELADERQQLEALTQKKQAAEFELVQIRSAIQSAQQKQQYAQKQLEQLAEQLAGFDHDKEENQHKLAAAQGALESETAALERLNGELSQAQKLIEQRQGAFADGQLELNQLNRQIEQHKSGVLDAMRQLSQINSRLGGIDIERKNLAAQQGKLSEREQVIGEEMQKLEAARCLLAGDLQAVLGDIQQQQAALEQKREESAKLGEQIAQASRQLGAAREHRSGLLSRQKLLADLEAKREGVSEGVKSILRQRETKFPFIRGLVADLLHVDVEHAQVIEAALDGRDQWLVAEDAQRTVASAEAFEDLEGRVNVMAESQVRMADATSGRDTVDWNAHGVPLRLAIDLVRFDESDGPLAGRLLGQTAVVDDLNGAMRLHHEGPCGWRYVTLDGQVVEADGTLRLGPLTATMGLLSRQAELQALRLQIAETEQRIEALSGQLSSGNEQARQIEREHDALRNRADQLNTRKIELNSALSGNEDKRNAIQREQPLLEKEMAQLAEQSTRLDAQQEQLAQNRAQQEQRQVEHEQQSAQLTQQQHDLNERIQQWAEELTAARVQLGQVQEKQLAARQQVRRQESAVGEFTQQITRLEQSAQTMVGRRQSVQEELEQAKYAEAHAHGRQAELEAAAQALAQSLAAAQQSVGGLSEKVEQMRQAHTQVEQELHGVQMRLGELNVRLETLIQRTSEELELDLPGRYTELAGDQGYQPPEADWEAIAAEIKELREKIQRLGNVNLDAIGEQDELEQRQQFLSAQVADLSSAKQQLEELIGQINVESSLRFEQCFSAVREHFQSMFRTLFGGGKADIVLETEIEVKAEAGAVDENGQPVKTVRKQVDVLDAGIEIIARPPGKQPVNISQLSGGEKTMTCIALLMSIFKSKPSPFCILDEVDAALDEANNQRFNLIVQEFLDQSQFIVITHSKRTMQIADVLYGVTMQEQGVSKRVAVKFDQVDHQGRITEAAAA